ncbi:MAG TPA: class I SAM-dependent methyltransferase [Mycobacteriales bacterium]|nr:class I SAM-dependent methyltransferase [Mycobacteriales bacterium]
MSVPESRLAQHYEERYETYRSFGTGLVETLAEELLPAGGSVLDVGCASGGLLARLQPKAGYAAGLELSATAAEAARAHADEVVCGALDADPAPRFAYASFDLVICADVLEHTVDPVASLQRAAGWCAPGGKLLISVPNIGYFAARARVLRGRFGYDDQGGIFDSGHLRFFTQSLLVSLVADAGLQLVSTHAVVPALRNSFPLLSRTPDRVSRAVERRWQSFGRRRPQLLGYQLVAVASPAGGGG